MKTPVQKPRRPRVPLSPEAQCPNCKVYKVNTHCTLRVCKQCCIGTTAICTLTDHARDKLGARKSYSTLSPTTQTTTSTTPNPSTTSPTPISGVVERIEAAIKTRSQVFVTYDGGSNGNRPRKIAPLRWLVEGVKVEVICYVSQPPKKKTFYAYKITRIEDYDWDLPPPQGKGMEKR